MKKIFFLFFTINVIIGLKSVASDTNQTETASCNAEILIKLKEPAKPIKTNEPVVLTVQVKNTSTNETVLFRIENLPTDFTWNITSPTGKDISPTNQISLGGSGWFPRLNPSEERTTDFDLSSICNFDEVGSYKIIVKKQVFSLLPERKKCEIVSSPLNIIISK